MVFWVRYLASWHLFLATDNFKWFWMERLHKNIQLMLELLELLYINDLPAEVICNIAIYADDITLYPECDQAPDL